MIDYSGFMAKGCADVLAGDVHLERPPADGGARWGLAAIMRPAGTVLDELCALARQAGRAAGAGHWVHGRNTLHFTLRSLERYRDVVFPDDGPLAAYTRALDAATGGTGPLRIELRGLTPHAGGVQVLGHPVDDRLATLQKRFAAELGAAGAVEHWVRDIWYVGLLHFAAPLTEPRRLVDWCDALGDRPFGTAEIHAVEIARFRLAEGAMTAQCLHKASLAGA